MPFFMADNSLTAIIMHRHHLRTLEKMSNTSFQDASPYLKCLLHSFKFPFAPVNGVFIGKEEGDRVVITDCVPLCHSVASISTTPLLEMALIQIDNLIGNDQSIVGYYFASDNAETSYSESNIPNIHLSIYTKIAKNFSKALLWVVRCFNIFI